MKVLLNIVLVPAAVLVGVLIAPFFLYSLHRACKDVEEITNEQL